MSIQIEEKETLKIKKKKPFERIRNGIFKFRLGVFQRYNFY